MRTRAVIALGIAASLFVPSFVRAQSVHTFDFQASGLYAGLYGDAYSGLGGGKGFEVQARFNPRSQWSIGAGYQYTSHEVFGLVEKLSLSGPFVEPRYVIPVEGFGRFVPYLSARFSLLQRKLNYSTVEASATGTTINLGGGIITVVSSSINIDAGVTYGYTSFGEFSIVDQASGARYDDPGGSGSNIVLRLGISLGVR